MSKPAAEHATPPAAVHPVVVTAAKRTRAPDSPVVAAAKALAEADATILALTTRIEKHVAAARELETEKQEAMKAREHAQAAIRKATGA